MNEPVARTYGVDIERDHALLDAQNIIAERGQQIAVRLTTEAKVSRDQLNSIKNRGSSTSRNFYSYPITYNPTVKELSRVGIRDKVEVLCYTAMKDWTDIILLLYP